MQYKSIYNMLTFSRLDSGKLHGFIATITFIFKILSFVVYFTRRPKIIARLIVLGTFHLIREKGVLTQLRRSFKQEVIYIQGAKLKQRKGTATRL